MNAYKQMLVAVDTTPEGKKVIERSLDLATHYQAAINLIHVIEPMMLDNSYESLPVVSIDIEKALYERAQVHLKKLADEVHLNHSAIHIEIGSVKGEIFRTVEKLNVDLLVIGTHGRHGVAMLLGSTANAVLHGTTCDVLAVRI